MIRRQHTSHLRAMRERAGHESGRPMTQQQIATRLGVTRQAVSFWERGATLPTAEHLMALCELFGCGPGDLFAPRHV